MLGLIIAMPQELEVFLEVVKEAASLQYKGKAFYVGKYNDTELVLALSGVGKVNAAYTAAVMLERFCPSFIINTGVAGGFGLAVYDVFAADKVVQHDIDTTALGDPKGYISGLDTVYIDADKDFIRLCKDKIKGIKTGVIASGDQFIASFSDAQRIVSGFSAAACDMESGAIGQVAYMAGVPFGIIRTITDNGDDSAQESFADKLGKAVQINKDAVLAVVDKL